MKLNANARLLLVTILAAMVFVPSAQRLKLAPRQSVNVEMQVALPLFVQVAMAAGDRFLAANIAAIRALWVDNFKMQKEEFKVLAKVQENVSWLNPDTRTTITLQQRYCPGMEKSRPHNGFSLGRPRLAVSITSRRSTTPSTCCISRGRRWCVELDARSGRVSAGGK